MLRTVRLPSLRVAAILLPLCFMYDVFWVFIQPMIFGGGRSVMVEVAKGGDSHEVMPVSAVRHNICGLSITWRGGSDWRCVFSRNARRGCAHCHQRILAMQLLL